jgi:Cu/Ag efflux pump CusA
MSKIFSLIIKLVVGIIIFISVCLNVYYFGYKQLEVNLMQKGFNIAVGQIINQVNTTGSVQLGENLILIKK